MLPWEAVEEDSKCPARHGPLRHAEHAYSRSHGSVRVQAWMWAAVKGKGARGLLAHAALLSSDGRQGPWWGRLASPSRALLMAPELLATVVSEVSITDAEVLETGKWSSAQAGGLHAFGQGYPRHS